MNIKPFFTGLLTGLFMAFLILFLWPKTPENIPIIKETFSAEKHPEEIQTPTHSVKAQGKKAVFTYTVPTEHYGVLKGEVQASRDALQYRHRVGLGAAALNGAVLGRLSYGYKNVDFALYGGWDYRRNEALFGAGLGYSWGF